MANTYDKVEGDLLSAELDDPTTPRYCPACGRPLVYHEWGDDHMVWRSLRCDGNGLHAVLRKLRLGWAFDGRHYTFNLRPTRPAYVTKYDPSTGNRVVDDPYRRVHLGH